MTAELISLKQQLADSVPVGFVYFQLPNQQEPKAIWPSTNWQEITSQYKNLFFRAEGDESGKFGQIQEESSPKLTDIRMNEDTNHCNAEYKPIPGVWKDDAIHLTGGGDIQHIQFFVSNDKVRPKNTAIKIWKRI